MSYLRKSGVSMVMLLAIIAVWGAGSASATEIYKYTTPSPNDTLGVGTELKISMKVGTSMIVKDTWWTGYTAFTCTGADLQGEVKSAGGEAAHPSGAFSSVKFSQCTHKLQTVANGEFRLQHIAGTTNATVTVNGLQLKYEDTVWGLECLLYVNGTVGTLTGATSATGHATIDITAAPVERPFCGSATLTGTFVVTAPTGLVVEAK